MKFEVDGGVVKLEMQWTDAQRLLRVLNRASSGSLQGLPKWWESFCVRLGLLLISAVNVPPGKRLVGEETPIDVTEPH